MKDKKVLWFDTETTGLDPNTNGICQLAAILEVNGEVAETWERKIQPFKGQIVEAKAVSVHGFTSVKMREEFEEPLVAHADFRRFLGRHINARDKSDKAYVGGQNVAFDVNFLAAWFTNCQDKYLGSWINWRKLDSLLLAHYANYKGWLDLENFKLETLTMKFGIELTAHDALSDVSASRIMFYELEQLIADKQAERRASL